MKKQMLAAAAAAVVSLAGAQSGFAQSANAGSGEIEALKAQLAALQDRLAQIEAQQAKQAKAVEDQQAATDHTMDVLAQTRSNVGEWVGRFTWKGDLRYRNENIEQDFVKDRNRDRIRARLGFVAKVNDTIRSEFELSTTEGADPRSSNQTLTDANSRKPFELSLAYAEWAPNANMKLTLGKMKYPWVRPGQSVFYDGDINPEGLAFNYVRGGFFADVAYLQLTERSTLANSILGQMQVGYRGDLAGGKYTLAASYFDYGAVQGYAVQTPTAAGFFGNTTTTSSAVCRSGAATCLRYDFNVTELLADYTIPVAGRPLSFFANYANNDDAVLDTAYAIGFNYGRASNPRTWEFGAFYQEVEKDALFGQFVDSDFGAGNTDTKGFVVKFGYAFAKNWLLNGTYFVNELNNSALATATGTATRDRDYKRLQLDLNMKF